MTELARQDEYRQWIVSIKSRVQASQIKAAVAVNRELLELYWFLGEQIIERQQVAKWGDGFLQQMSKDLTEEFAGSTGSSGGSGFSLRNLQRMRRWVAYWADYWADSIGLSEAAAVSPQPLAERGVFATQAVSQTGLNATQLVSQIPWGHNLLIIQKLSDPAAGLFYVQKTIENNWSRSVLTHQIESGLHLRQGAAANNFHATLPQPQSDLALQLLRDPYNFDFLTLTERHNERELEDGLVTHLTQFLLELGAGFAYVGRQYKLEVAGDEYSIDLLFYHLRLHCYIVIELKAGEFKPEYVGKLNFYISAVDTQVRSDVDQPSIGILICKSKSDVKVEYSLRDLKKPIGVSEYLITRSLPEELKSSLPSIEEIEAEIGEWGE